MKKTLRFTAMVFLILTSQAFPCFNPTDFFAVEVVLSKAGIGYNKGIIKSADNVALDDESIIYRAHFDKRVAVILEEINQEAGADDILKGLSVRLQIPTKSVVTEYISSGIDLGNTTIGQVDEESLRALGYDVDIEDNADSVSLKKGNVKVIINQADLEIRNSVVVTLTVIDTNELTDEVKGELRQIATIFGFKEGLVDELEANLSKSEMQDLVAAVDIDRDKFDFPSAMKVELDWLKSNGIISGLTTEDISSISALSKAGAAGWNSRIVNEDGKWIPYYETGNAVFVDARNCGGFELDNVPQGNISLPVTSVKPNDKLATRWGEIKTAF